MLDFAVQIILKYIQFSTLLSYKFAYYRFNFVVNVF